MVVNQLVFGGNFFSVLEQIDEAIARAVALGGCVLCGGPLHRSDYDRKPRGAHIAPEGEQRLRRFSLCCGRKGCRKRNTPPSLRFLSRRVYLGVVVIVASLVAQASGLVAAALRHATGVPARTVGRWLHWWRGPLLATEVFDAVRVRWMGVDESELPASMLARLEGELPRRVGTLLMMLLPLTGGSFQSSLSLSGGIA